jgi:2-polyprenyl-3-methyl-5-hydroxy-6-metoxy-1,4-benzoquinol methylase
VGAGSRTRRRATRARYDTVVSNSLLHHLPDPGALWDTIRRCAAPGAPVVVMDLFSPASAEAALAIVDRYAAGEAQVLHHDFLASLHASFEPGEIQGQLAVAKLDGLNVQVVSDRHVLVLGGSSSFM